MFHRSSRGRLQLFCIFVLLFRNFIDCDYVAVLGMGSGYFLHLFSNMLVLLNLLSTFVFLLHITSAMLECLSGKFYAACIVLYWAGLDYILGTLGLLLATVGLHLHVLGYSHDK